MLGKRYGFNCPHCGRKMTTKMSRVVNQKLQERYLECSNQQCAAVYKAFVELKDVISELLDQREKSI